jgi:hypothetical protein
MQRGIAKTPEEAMTLAQDPQLIGLVMKDPDEFAKRSAAWDQFGDPNDAEGKKAYVLGLQSGGDQPSDVKAYEYAARQGYKGTFEDWQTKSQRTQDPTFGNEMNLRQEYDLLPEVKDYKTVKANYERIRQGVQMGTGAGDAAIVFGYMKMLDPTSVVRDSEQANARNAAGVPEQVRGMWNNVFGGGQLSEEARQQILQASDKVYSEASQNIGDLNKRYSGIAGQYELAPDRIITQPENYEPLSIGKTIATPDGVTITRTK